MSKIALRKKITNLLDNVPDGEVIEIFYTNPVSGETKLIYQSPAAKGLQVEVDSPATAETFNKLRNHEQNTPEATDR
jgi:TusA-related sulfurtransferase